LTQLPSWSGCYSLKKLPVSVLKNLVYT
jgi:hypothetical protein